MSISGFVWLGAFIVGYCLIGFGFYKFCRLLAKRVAFFDSFADTFGLDDELPRMGMILWAFGWIALAPAYLVLHIVILLIANLCFIALVAWITIFPPRAPRGLFVSK